MYLSRITICLDTTDKFTFQDFHTLINVESPGLQLDRDVITNLSQSEGIYVTGVNPRAARAIARQAYSYNLPVVRLDLTFTGPCLPEVVDRAEYLDANWQTTRLKKHLADLKYRGGTRDFTRFDVHCFTMGGDKAVKQLEIRDKTESPVPIPALEIVWRLRNNWAKEAWTFVQKSDNLDRGIDNAFCAATNSFLGPDWFHLGHNQELFLDRSANSVLTEKPKKDWRLMLEQACKLALTEIGDPESTVEELTTIMWKVLDPYKDL